MSNAATVARRIKQAAKQHARVMGATTPHTHELFIHEGSSRAQSEATGLPILVAAKPTPMYPVPRVLVGGAETSTEGAPLRVGDARVSRIDPEVYPVARLLAADGFSLDDPEGDLYTILNGQVVDDGLSGLSMVLTREQQPRPIAR